MRILVIHNTYTNAGGEDAVVRLETALLTQHGQEVEQLIFDNKNIGSGLAAAKLSYQSIYNVHAARQLEQKIGEFAPDVVHVHNLFYVASASVLYIARKHRIPVVLTLHNYRTICINTYLLRNHKPCELCIKKTFPLEGIRYACYGNSRLVSAQLTVNTALHKMIGTWKNKVNKYITLTPFTRNMFLNSSLHPHPEQIVIKPNSVDDLGYSEANARKDYFLFIGRLSEEKGIRTLMDAANLGDFQLEIIGDGPLREWVEKEDAGKANITCWGFRDKAFITEKLRSCRALLFPSIWYEGLPITVLEAFSTGTPVICSDIQNVRDIITDAHNGIHFETGNAADLSRKIDYFTEHQQQLRHLYRNARQTFLDKYSHEKNYQQLMGIYHTVIQDI